MDKLKMHSPDFVKENVAKLAELFPTCIVETKDDNGNLKKSIDFDQLRQELSTSIVEGPRERYHLDWPGKREALLTANAPIAKTLRPCREESVDFDTTKNLFIEGDNLDALKLLQETYLNKVKMIYIDPPYNTGNDFIYDDDFSEDIASYFERSNQKENDGGHLIANLETNGRFHSDWLSMMYPRLKLARDLLKDDGVIFISIDDNEASNLRIICDQVFGRKSFRAQISWQKKYSVSNNFKGIASVRDFIFVYSKSELFSSGLLPRTEASKNRYQNPDNDSRGPWKPVDYWNIATIDQRPNCVYPIINPNSGEKTIPTKKSWKYEESTHKKHVEENRIYWGRDGLNSVPALKLFLSDVRDGMIPHNWWPHEVAGHTDEAKKYLDKLFDGTAPFDTPKPLKLIERMLQIANLQSNDIIMDFYAGSSSTAEAVIKYVSNNICILKFIMVQLDEVCEQKTEGFKQGYNTIADIGKERIRRAGKKIKEENSDKEGIEQLDIGFRVLKVDSSNMNEVRYAPDTLKHDDLFGQVDNIRADRTPEDLLFQVLLDWGVDLTLPIKQATIAGKTVFFVDGSEQNMALAACFETDVNEAFVKELATRKPLRVVFRDSSFENDSVKINIEQIFKLMSPSTDVKVI